MNKQIRLPLVAALLLVLITACNSRPKESGEKNDPLQSESNQSLEKEAWKIHDEVMPKMGAIHKRKSRVKEMLAQPEKLTPEDRQALEKTLAELDQAYDGMMNWMRNFKPEQHGESEEATRVYLEDQILAITKVKEDILNVMAKTDSLQTTVQQP